MPDEVDSRLPEILFAQASPRSVGGTSLFEADDVTVGQAVDYTSEDQVVAAAEERLTRAGFRVLQRSPQTLNIAGPPALYQEYFGTRLVTEEREVVKPGAQETTATFIDSPDTDLPGLISTAGTPVGDVVEGVAIEEPVFAFQNATPPKVNYWHLEVPDQVAALLGANRAHQKGIKGNGIRLTMVDSGWFRHPYFIARNLNGTVVLGPGANNPAADENGHGTGESANALALAPGIDFSMVKANFVNILGAFNTAVARTPAPQIISNSWGYDVPNQPLSAIQRALAWSVELAAANGIIVVFSAGNGHWGFPAQHPAVIAAGGVYVDQVGNARASDYASGFASRVYPGRNVPDLSGLVGLLPRAAYIMLPVPAGCEIDRDLGNGAAFPNGDETAPNDGWAAFSGTSAAAPQIAGICALIRQTQPGLNLRGMRNALTRTAKDITTGTCNPRTGGHAARPGFDLATGWGLADAQAAVHAAVPAAGGPAAYARGTDRHVFYRGADNLLRELWWSPTTGGWRVGDLGASALGIPATGNPAAYLLGDSQHVVFRGTDGRIHELWWSPASGGWRTPGLDAAAQGLPAAGDPHGYVLGDSQHVVFRGTDSRVHELWWTAATGWSVGGTSAVAQAVPAAGEPYGYVLGDSQHIVYRGTDGRVHELWWSAPTGWQRGGLDAVAQGIPAAGDPQAYVLGDSQHVVFRGTDSHVHELWWTVATGWRVGGTSAVAQAVPAAGEPFGYVLADTQHIVYRGTDGRIHELWWSAPTGWQRGGLDAVAQGIPAAGDPQGYVVGDAQRVVYRGADGLLNELCWTAARGWYIGDL
ncbi:Subtilase family protein [Streptomyces sp. cf386]|uniref:S8 family serine peptidase n=1 Tax=Streptomyces sp. cf386 TaxID=1761904 RepID=UPI00088D8EEA|nr:S8 family serine peptidase [Streptomyces sp. cf386]SDN67581.1 Subtilase family protein [Streptomyces sp. cf386]